MKKLFLAFTLFISFTGFSQQELKLDIIDALALRTIEVSYEHYMSNQSSIGVSALFNFEGKGSDFRYNEETMITPFFRHYFSTESKWNFFSEMFLGINFGEREVINGLVNTYLDYTDAALGIGIGTKYVSEGGLILDVHAGLGRNLFGSDSPVIVPRVGVGIGYQFK